MTLAEFLLARIAEDEREATVCLAQYARGDGGSRRRWDRVRAECEAKRRIVEIHEHMTQSGLWNPHEFDFGCSVCHEDRDYGIAGEGWCDTIKALALPYADHSDFREEWRA